MPLLGGNGIPNKPISLAGLIGAHTHEQKAGQNHPDLGHLRREPVCTSVASASEAMLVEEQKMNDHGVRHDQSPK
jgi:hypothetical protein